MSLFCKTESDSHALSDKNIQVCKSLLNIAHCLGYLLDVKSWFIILQTMQDIEKYIAGKMKPRTNKQTITIDYAEIKSKVTKKIKE